MNPINAALLYISYRLKNHHGTVRDVFCHTYQVDKPIMRPAPIQGDMVHPYPRRREGIEPVACPNPELKTMLGKTMPVTLNARNFNCYVNPMLKREVCGGDFDATIARSRWGMDWGLKHGFPDEVRLVVQVEAIRQ